MNIVPIVKTVAGVATSFGAGAVVGNAIKATTPTNMKRATKILVGFGAVVLSSIAGDVAGRYVEEQIQNVADGVRVGKFVGETFARARHTAAAPEEAEEAPDVPTEGSKGEEPVDGGEYFHVKDEPAQA